MKIVAVNEIKKDLETENKIEKVQEKASDKLSNAAETVHTKTDKAQEVLGEKVENAGDILRKKTYEVGDYAQQKLEKANELGHRAADMIDNSSQYIKDFDVAETKEKVIQTIRKNPEIGIALAGVFGLLVGYLAGRKSK